MSKKLNREIKCIDHLQGHNKRQGSAHYTDRDIRVVCTESSYPVFTIGGKSYLLFKCKTLRSCSIKLVAENHDRMLDIALHLILYSNKFNKNNNTGFLTSMYFQV